MSSKLIRAVAQGKEKQVSKLLSKNPSLLNASNSKGETALTTAIENMNKQMVDFLLSFDGIDVCAGERGKSPLDSAFAVRDERLCKELVRRGATVHALVHHCIAWRMSTLLRVIMRKARDNASMVAEINTRFGENGQTIIHSAVIAADSFLLETLLRLLSRLKTEAASMQPGAAHSTDEGFAQTRLTVADDHSASGKQLPVDVDTVDCMGFTPLWRAVECHSVAMIRILLQNGADIDALNGENKQTIAHLIFEVFADCCQTKKEENDGSDESGEFKREETAESGDDSDYVDSRLDSEETGVSLESAPHLALRMQFEALLSEFNADLGIEDTNGRTPADLRKSEEQRIEAEMEDFRKETERIGEVKREEMREKRRLEKERLKELGTLESSLKAWLVANGLIPESDTVTRNVFEDMFSALKGMRLDLHGLLHISRVKLNSHLDEWSKRGALSVERRRAFMAVWKKERAVVDEKRRVKALLRRSEQMEDGSSLKPTPGDDFTEAIMQAVANGENGAVAGLAGAGGLIALDDLSRHLDRNALRKAAAMTLPLKGMLVDFGVAALSQVLDYEGVSEVSRFAQLTMHWLSLHLQNKHSVSEDDCYRVMYAVKHLRKEIVFEMRRKFDEDKKQRRNEGTMHATVDDKTMQFHLTHPLFLLLVVLVFYCFLFFALRYLE